MKDWLERHFSLKAKETEENKETESSQRAEFWHKSVYYHNPDKQAHRQTTKNHAWKWLHDKQNKWKIFK